MVTYFRSSIHWLWKSSISDGGSVALIEEWFVDRGGNISNEDPAYIVNIHLDGMAMGGNAYPRIRPGFDKTTSV